MQHTWERWKMHTVFQLEDLDIDGKLILEWIFMDIGWEEVD